MINVTAVPNWRVTARAVGTVQTTEESESGIRTWELRDVIYDESRRWRERGQQWRAMEDCSTDERPQQETLCHRQWTDE